IVRVEGRHTKAASDFLGPGMIAIHHRGQLQAAAPPQRWQEIDGRETTASHEPKPQWSHTLPRFLRTLATRRRMKCGMRCRLRRVIRTPRTTVCQAILALSRHSLSRACHTDGAYPCKRGKFPSISGYGASTSWWARKCKWDSLSGTMRAARATP